MLAVNLRALHLPGDYKLPAGTAAFYYGWGNYANQDKQDIEEPVTQLMGIHVTVMDCDASKNCFQSLPRKSGRLGPEVHLR